jgi:site-specific DNA recombinase
VFDPVWERPGLREQARVVELLGERVDYDGGKGTVAVTFHAAGIKTLAEELARQQSQGRSA